MLHLSRNFIRSLRLHYSSYTLRNKRFYSNNIEHIDLQLNVLKDKDREILCGIQYFYQKYQHYAIPYHYIIPSNATKEWNKNDISCTVVLSQYPLGKRVHYLVSSIQMKGSSHHLYTRLQQIQFPIYTFKYYWMERIFIPALQSYKDIHGHLLVPQKFIVPMYDNKYPELAWGMNLGVYIMNLRKQVKNISNSNNKRNIDQNSLGTMKQGHQETLEHEHQETVEEEHQRTAEQTLQKFIDQLNAIGFVWSVLRTKWYDYFMPGMEIYKKVYGDAFVKQKFIIPATAPWPKHLHGYPLGHLVMMVRSGIYAEYVEESRDKLQELGFTFDYFTTIWESRIYPALKVYEKLHGHGSVPQDFIVPTSSKDWPKELWKFPLGQYVKRLREGKLVSNVNEEELKDLKRMGTIKDEVEQATYTFYNKVLPTLKLHKKLYGHLVIPPDFVVPSQYFPKQVDINLAVLWPKEAQGFPLGRWIRKARNNKIYLPKEHKEALDTLGFTSSNFQGRWNDVVLPAFKKYAELHGSCASMNSKFEVPESPEYPMACWGLKLGGTIWHIRNGSAYVRDEAKRKELIRLGVFDTDEND